MQETVGQAWITLFYGAANFIGVFAAVIGVVAAYGFWFRAKDFIGRDSGQRGSASGLVAYFLVACTGLEFASFVYTMNESVYHGTGAIFASTGNPITWRAENTPALNGMSPEMMMMAVILIGFSFLGAVAFFLAMLTMYRFDKDHPEHYGATKDFFMYSAGGVITTQIDACFSGLSGLLPFLSSTSDFIQRTSDLLG